MTSLPQGEGAIRCPVCACPIGEEPRACPRCATPHHVDCWEYAGGCAIFGCDPRGWERLPEAGALAIAQAESCLVTWTRVFTVHWYSFAVAMLGLFTTFGSQLLHWVLATGPYRYSQGFHVPGLIWLGLLGWLAFFVGLAVYVVLIVPSWVLRWRLERYLKTRLARPGGSAARRVADSLEVPVAGRAIAVVQRGLSVVIVVLIVAAILAMLGQTGGGRAVYHGRYVYVIMELLFLRFLVLAPLGWATRRRMAHLATLQNRLVASLKADRDGGD